MMTTPISVKVSRLKSILIDDSKPRPVFLLGAGASVKSGIPLVRDLVQQIARVGYCHDQGWDFRDPRPQQSDWLQWLKAQTWYDVAAPLEVTYPRLVERVLVPKHVRKDFFQRALRERASPSPATTRGMPGAATAIQRVPMTTFGTPSGWVNPLNL